MKRMKGRIIALAALMVLLLSVSGCQSKEEAADEYALRYASVGEIIDTGVIKAVCPTGWTNAEAYDLTKSTRETVNYILEYVKGGKSASENKPVLRIRYHTADEGAKPLSRDLYQDSYEVQTFTAGKYTWKGFSAVSGEERFAYVSTFSGEVFLEAWLFMHPDSEIKASLNDQDVYTVFESLIVAEPKKK